MKDNQMSRGTSQALYKYLPDSWIDFSLRGKYRKNYIAHVVRWNSEKLVDINKKRLLRLVNQSVKSFESLAVNPSQIPPVSGFGGELSTDNCEVLTPKSGGEERGIIAEISPLTFYCKQCHEVHTFSSSLDYEANKKCSKCNVEWSQIRQIYFHKCGFATDKHRVYCFNCKSSKNIKYYGKYEFVCGNCKQKIDMNCTCECGERLGPHVALDPSQFFPFSLSFVDLINEEDEKFISDTSYGAYATLLNWIGKVEEEDFAKIKENGIVVDEKKYEETYQSFLKTFAMLPNASEVARIASNDKCGNQYGSIISDFKSKLYTTENELKLFSEMIMEYKMINNSKDVSTLGDAKNVALKLNTSANPDYYDVVAERFGIVNAKVCSDIPFVCCSYGYTREKAQYEDNVQLRAFKEEKPGTKNVYANKLRTEGVLFEFDRKKILKWLIDNNVLLKDDAPNLESDEEIKLWFINNVHLGAISVFSKIDEENEKYTYWIYSLIHSISHLLMKSASELCGLNKDSISEYIFAGIPAVMIYCQNSQGFSLGALFNVFEAYFDKWILNAKKHADKCIYDPLCIDRYKACTGCLFSNEISCQHYNHDLNRQLIIGHFDKINNKAIKGFWEE